MKKTLLLRIVGAAFLLWSGSLVMAQESIEPGATINGTLSAEMETAEYAFNGQAGDQVTIHLRSRAFDALLRLNNADGEEIASNDDTEGSLNSAITGFVLPDDGEYIIVVDSADAAPEGNYTLEFEYGSTQTIAYGDVVEGEITAAVPTALYQFVGSAGDSVGIGLYADSFDAFLSLSDSEGEITSDDDGGGNTNSLISGFTLPADGTYTILARPLYEGPTGAYRLELGTVTVMPLTPDEPATGEVAGERLYYTFEAQAGDQITLRMDAAPDLDSEIRVTGPQGYMLSVDDDSGLGLNPELNNLVADFGGTYTVALYTVRPDAAGPFTLTLSMIEPTDLAFDEPQTVAFAYKHYQYAFRFEGTAGDTVRLTFTPIDVEISNLSVNIVQAAESLTSTYSDGVITPIEVEAEIPADGEVRVLLADYDYRGNTYEVLLEHVENDAD